MRYSYTATVHSVTMKKPAIPPRIAPSANSSGRGFPSRQRMGATRHYASDDQGRVVRLDCLATGEQERNCAEYRPLPWTTLPFSNR